MMLDIIPIWKTHDASDGDNRNGRNELTVFLHDFRLNGGQRFLLRAFCPDHRTLDGPAGLIFHENLNVSADRARPPGRTERRKGANLPAFPEVAGNFGR